MAVHPQDERPRLSMLRKFAAAVGCSVKSLFLGPCDMGDKRDFDTLESYLKRVSGINHVIGAGHFNDDNWWVKFTVDLDHPLAWNVVQELSCVLNYLSVEDRLPTVFMPVSPAAYLNGGPKEFLSWVIESKDPQFKPEACTTWLEGRLPRPVDDESAWADDDA